MSNLETRPDEVRCPATPEPSAATVETLRPRDVPLGGPRAMTVRRTLPQRQRSLIGAWCFVDHYGPDLVADSGGMRVPPHPHTGLQTVSWLFTGEVEHRDSAGFHAFVRPGEVNLMTAGRGISHSEVSTPATETLHGVQLWIALPSYARFTAPAFEHHAPEPIHGQGFAARVLLGTLLGSSSPVLTHSSLVGAELVLAPGAELVLDVTESFEHGVLVDHGIVAMEGTALEPATLGYRAPGSPTLALANPGPGTARLMLIGGEPLGEQIVMWWNFVGRSHEEIVEWRANWQAEIGAEPVPPEADLPQFRLAAADPLPPLPAPALPNARIKPRPHPGL